MAYKNNVPQPGDSPATDSQPDFLENFSQLDSQYGTAGDHVAFSAGADNGLHKKIRLNGVIADPNEPDPRASLYLKTIAANSELFFENFDVGAASNLVRQMTNLTITTAANAGTAGGNISHVDTPWGLRVMWGTTNSFSGLQTVIVPAGTTILNYQLTGNVASGSRNPINGGIAVGLTLSINTVDNVSVRYFILGTY